jgi:hypothetical protein
MKQRCNELNASWAFRTSRLTTRGYMIREGRLAHHRHKLAKSVLSTEDNNPNMTEYKRIEWQKCAEARRSGNPEKFKLTDVKGRRELKKIRDKKRKIDIERTAESLERVKPIITLTGIELVKNRKKRRLLPLWTIRKLVGKPSECKKCQKERGTYSHERR